MLWRYQCYCMDAPPELQQEKKLDGNDTRILPAVWSKSWKQYSNEEQQLTSHITNHRIKNNWTWWAMLEKTHHNRGYFIISDI